jgi:hypothetical protein
MFGSSNSLPAKDQRPMGQDYRRSATNEEARVLPVLYGRQRIGCTFISDFFDIRSESVSTGGKHSTKAGTNYYASFAVAVCHGPVGIFHDLYLNGEPVFASSTKLYAVALSQTDNIATFQTKNPHGLSTGETVIIHGANQPEFNGEFTVTVVSDKQFQYVIPGTTLASETATTSSQIYALVKLAPIPALGADETTITIPDFGTATIHWGTETQAADAYLSSVSGIPHPPYKGICYIVFHQLFLGFNQTNAQNVEVVVERTPSFDWMSNPAHAVIAGDSNPACIVADTLFDRRAGLALDENLDVNTDSFDDAAEQFFAESVGLSPLTTRPEDLRTQWLAALEIVDAAPVLDTDGKIALSLQRLPQAQINAPHPNVVQPNPPYPTITADNLSDLPNFQPGDWSGVTNETRLTFLDRDSGWQPDFAEWKDNAGIYAKDRPEPQTLDRQLVTHRDLALRLVAIAGQVAALPAKNGTLKLIFAPDLYIALAPGSLFQFTYTPRSALNGLYRVTSRAWPDPAKPEFEIEVAVDRSYLYTQALPAPASQVVTSLGVVKSIDPIQSPTAPPLEPIPDTARFAIVELPPALCPNQPALAALIARDNASITTATLWLGANYDWFGNPVNSFSQFASVTKFAWHGALLADYPADTNVIDLQTGILVQLDGVDLVLPDTTPFDALADRLLVFLGDEILSVTHATLLAVGLYRLQVVRGRFASPVTSHASGDVVFVVTRDALVPLTHPQFQPNNVARFKLTFGDGDVADVDPFDVSLTGASWRVPPPCALSVNGAKRNAVFSGVENFSIAWVLPDAGATLQRCQIFTLLEFLTPDGSSVLHSEMIAWQENQFAIAWADISALPAQSFLLRAATIVRTAFVDVAGWPATLAVAKL